MKFFFASNTLFFAINFDQVLDLKVSKEMRQFNPKSSLWVF